MRPHPSRRDKGASMVELAICMPIVLMFLFGIADFGRVLYMSIEVTNAAAAGAYYGSYKPANTTDTTGIAAAAAAEAPDVPVLKVTSSQVCQDSNANTVSCATSGAYQYASVTASSTFTSLCKYPFIPTTVNLSKTVMMRAK